MPTPSSLYIDSALTQISGSRAANQYVADKVFPILNVNKMTGKVWKSDPNNARFRKLQTTRAPSGSPNTYEGEDPTAVSYETIDHSLKGYISDEEREQVEPAVQADVDKLEDIQNAILLEREINLVAALAAALVSTYTVNVFSASKVWGASDGNMIGDLMPAKKIIRDGIGQDANSLIITEDEIDAAFETAALKERMLTVMTPDEISKSGKVAILAAMLGIRPENIHVPRVYQNTAMKGQTPVMVNVWANKALFYYAEPPKVRSQNLGLHINYVGNGAGMAGNVNGFLVERERIADRKADAIYLHNYYAQVLLNATAGVWFTHTLANA